MTTHPAPISNELRQLLTPQAKSALATAGSGALAGEFALSGRLMNELERLIVARVDGLRAERALMLAVLAVALVGAAYFSIPSIWSPTAAWA